MLSCRRVEHRWWVGSCLIVACVVGQARDRCAADVEPANARVIATLKGQSGATLAFGNDGTTILTAGTKAARVWDVRTGKPLTEPLVHGNGLVYATFDPAAAHVLTRGDDNLARVWDVRTGNQVRVLAHEGRLHFATFSRDGGKIVTCGQDGRANVWDSATGKLLMELRHPHAVRFAAFLPDNDKMITCSIDGTRVWELSGGKRLVRRPDGGPNDDRDDEWVSPVAVHPNGAEVASASGWLGVCWDPATGDGVFAVDTRNINAWPNLVGYTSQGELVTASRGVQVWDRKSEDTLETLVAPGSPVHDFRVSPDGKRILVAAGDDASGLWDTKSRRQLLEFRGNRSGNGNGGLFAAPDREVPAIAMSRDGRRIATGFVGSDTTEVYQLGRDSD